MPSKKKERIKWGIMIFIAFIMIGTSFSVVFFGFSDFSSSDTVRFNGIKFVKLKDRWEAKINGKDAAFSFLPEEVKNISVEGDVAALLSGKLEIDSTYDLNSNFSQAMALAQHQFGLTLSTYGIFVRNGLTNKSSFNLPVITCNDSSSYVPVIYFRTANSTGIRIENSCIVARALDGTGFIKAKDRILYEMFGVYK